MDYSPIIVPVVLLVMCGVLRFLAGIPGLLRVVLAEDFDPPLTFEEKERNAKKWAEGFSSPFDQPVLFYVLCLALANIGAGGGLATWLAWGFAGSWTALRLPRTFSNNHIRCLAGFVASLTGVGLTVYAGIRVILDVLSN